MAHLEMEFLGIFRARRDGNPLTDFESSKVRALLAYLAVEAQRPHSRERLAALLWPDWPESAARSNLRYALADLRKVISDRTAKPPFLNISREAIQFNIHSEHWLDVAEFSNLSSTTQGTGIERLERAIELYKGEFLEGFSISDAAPWEDWVRLKRQQLQRCYLEALHRLAAVLEECGEHEGALQHAYRLVEVEPLDESAHRQVMCLLAFSGRRGEALAQYEACREVLRAELGAEPSQETEELYQVLLSGELPPAGMETLQPERPPRQVGACPYRGLAVFREQDAQFFFGREEFTRRLQEALGRWPMVAVVLGSSGSGKSSAVYAGLLPRLRAQGDWEIASLRPREQPFRNLAGTLIPQLEPELNETERLIQAARLEEALREGELSLEQVVARAVHRNGDTSRLLLVVDQFEELYTLCPDPEMRRGFLDELLGAVGTQDGRFVLLLTMRADFMGQALAYRPFADALQAASVLLGPMNREELRAAVEMPAEMQGAAFEPGLVERLLDDVGQEPGNLPLLEFALTLLWEHNEDGWLTHQAYEDSGRVEGALACYADQVFEVLDEEDQERARRALVQLVRPGEGTEDTRRVATHTELGEENWQLTRYLADRRLVVTGTDSSGSEIAEVVHEALIQKWGRFRGWMEADRAFRLWQERLRANLRQWLESEQDEGALLGGAPLAVAQDWLAERQSDISRAETEYIQASLARQERRRRERQRRRQWTIVGLTTGLVVAVALAAFALYQRQNSMRQAAILLAGQAESELANGYHDRAVLLAWAALEDYPYTVQAEHALGQAVLYNRALQTYPNHTSAVTSIAWSPDGKRVATSCSRENRVDIWDPVTGESILVIDMPTGITGYIYDMALHVQWTADGERLLTVNGDRYMLGSQDYDLLLWDADTGELISSIEIANQAEPAMELAELGLTTENYPTGSAAKFAPHSGRLATLGGDNTAIIWGEDWQKPALLLSGHTQDVNSVDWSPDEMMLATASLDGTSIVWDAQTGEALYTLTGHEGRVNLALWSPEGSSLVTAGEDGTLRFWDAEAGELVHTIDTNTGEVISLAWAPNSVRIISGHADGGLRIWEVATGSLLETLRGHEGLVTDLKWSPAGDDRLVSADGNGNVRVWNVAPSTAWRLYPPQAAQGGNWSVIANWSSDGRYLAVVHVVDTSQPPFFAIWDVLTNRLIMENLGDALNPEIAREVAWGDFSPDDQEILYRGFLDTAYIFDAQSGQIVKTFKAGSDNLIAGTSWSPDGSQLATGFFIGEIIIWDYETGEQITKLVHNTEGYMINSVEWSPDGSKFAAGSADAKIWDAHTWELLLTLKHEKPAEVNVVSWSPDSTRLLTGGVSDVGAKDTTARVWDASTGEELLVFSGHTGNVWPGSWSPNGERIATLGAEGTVRVWDSSTGDELLTLSIPLFFAGYTWWSPDGQYLAISGLDTLVSVWRVWQSTEELIDYAKECCVFRQLTEQERKQFALP